MFMLIDAGGGGKETTGYDGIYTRRNVWTPGEVQKYKIHDHFKYIYIL